MSLQDYARKRKFSKTPEPGPVAEAPRPGRLFCVQRHAARQTHYDLRLEHNGTLLSWAVPQGPTLDSGIKRLAVHVEDHPVAYGSFEGVIPAGNYGAGSVMLWDTGEWQAVGDMSVDKQLERGDLKFLLQGGKLRGMFGLVRTRSKGKQEEWLLLKKPDSFAVGGWAPDDFAWSIASGRRQHEIEAGLDAPAIAMPKVSSVMLAERSGVIPTQGDWIYEIKWDGVRALAYLDCGRLELIARSGTDITRRYPELGVLPSLVRTPRAILDGEIAVCDEQGRPRFELIQPRIHSNEPSGRAAIFFAFDLLFDDRQDLRDLPLRERRRRLEDLLVPAPALRYSDAFADGTALLAAAHQMGLEGVLAKKASSPYRPRRSGDWLKIKTANEDNFRIAGFVRDRREPFGSLMLADDAMKFVGNVGTGFNEEQVQDLYRRLKPLETERGAFALPAGIKGEVHWVKPELRCRVKYLEITTSGRLRAPVYLGLADEAAMDPPAPALAPGPAPATQKPAAVTNPKKVLFPDDGITKLDLVSYYDAVAEWILPHLKDRPLTLLRYPDGIGHQGFFQKDVKGKLPAWFPTVEVEDVDGARKHLACCNSREALLHLANLACIDMNPWMSREGTLDHPDFLLIDLDPFETAFSTVVESALRVKALLDQIGLRGYPKTTGGNGMHIYVPLETHYSFEHTRAFAEALCRTLARQHPKLLTLPRAVSQRTKGRVYFDWMQNGRGKSISAPYVVRPRPGAHVATPLEWHELRPTLSPSQFHLRNAPDRFRKSGDLFQQVLTDRQELELALEKLSQLAAH